MQQVLFSLLFSGAAVAVLAAGDFLWDFDASQLPVGYSARPGIPPSLLSSRKPSAVHGLRLLNVTAVLGLDDLRIGFTVPKARVQTTGSSLAPARAVWLTLEFTGDAVGGDLAPISSNRSVLTRMAAAKLPSVLPPAAVGASTVLSIVNATVMASALPESQVVYPEAVAGWLPAADGWCGPAAPDTTGSMAMATAHDRKASHGQRAPAGGNWNESIGLGALGAFRTVANGCPADYRNGTGHAWELPQGARAHVAVLVILPELRVTSGLADATTALAAQPRVAGVWSWARCR